MKVKIGNVVYDSGVQPIDITLTETDKDNISNMASDATHYCCYPDHIDKEVIRLWVMEEGIKNELL